MLHHGAYPAGIIGEPWQLHSYAAPSQWYLVAYNDALGNQLSSTSGTWSANGQSGSLLRQYVTECAPALVACGSTVTTYDGKSIGPTDQGIDTRIHASADGLNNGQDSINTSVGPPFPITGGANNPDPALIGQTYYGPSDSEALVPVYGGKTLNAGGDTTQVIGFMHLFIQDVVHQATSDQINVVVLNVVGCASGGDDSAGSSTPSLTQAGGAPIPIRLIRAQ